VILRVALAWGLLAALTTAQSTPLLNQRAIQEHCNVLSSKQGGDFTSCVNEETSRLRARNLECAKLSQMQNVTSADLPSFIQRCLATESVEAFRSKEVDARQAMGLKTAQEIPVGTDVLGTWTNFDGAVKLRINRVLLVQWFGGMQNGLAHGPGELVAEIEHVVGNIDEKRVYGTVNLSGLMNQGHFSGVVKAQKHPAFANSKDRAVSNAFVDGRSVGLMMDQPGSCEASPNDASGVSKTRFYGACRAGSAYSGLVVSEFRGKPFDIACLSRGHYASPSELDAFEPCESFWRHLPDYCAVGDYKGQCLNGVAHGVGIQKTIKREETFNKDSGVLNALSSIFTPGIRSYYLKRGNFAKGELSGYGYSGLLEGCGMAGCSGDRGEKTGWFEKGQFKFACTTISTCMRNVSGADYTQAMQQAPVDPGAGKMTPQDFASAMSAYRTSGERPYLRQANQLAKTRSERAELEYELIRIAGFNKAFVSRATLTTRGDQQINFDQKDQILGYIRNTDSSVPLRVHWEVRNDSDAVSIKHGSYLVDILVGVRARMKRTTCLGSVCRDQVFTEVFETRTSADMSPTRANTSGTFDLRQSMNSASVMFGTTSMRELLDIDPYIQIESVKGLP
jgi:hypothetical protein